MACLTKAIYGQKQVRSQAYLFFFGRDWSFSLNRATISCEGDKLRVKLIWDGLGLCINSGSSPFFPPLPIQKNWLSQSTSGSNFLSVLSHYRLFWEDHLFFWQFIFVHFISLTLFVIKISKRIKKGK